MIYVAFVILSFVSCYVGFLLEAVESNIRHVENGRKPNAGAAIFPAIPLVPLAYIVAIWCLNNAWPNLGYVSVATYSIISMGIRYRQYKRACARLGVLLATQSTEHAA